MNPFKEGELKVIATCQYPRRITIAFSEVNFWATWNQVKWTSINGTESLALVLGLGEEGKQAA